MSNKLKMARQPIVDLNNNVIGNEFFYRNDAGEGDFTDPRSATSSVLVNILNQVGLNKSIGDAKAFINISGDLLLTDILYNLPKDPFVFELSADVQMGNKELANLEQLHLKGYTFALDNVRFDDDYIQNFTPALPYISYVKIDASQTDFESLEKNLALFRDQTLIAQKIEFQEIFDAYKAMGFRYFQGYFIAGVHTIEQNRIDPKHLGVIRIFNMLESDYQMDEICAEFERHNELTLQLLQFVKSIPKFNWSESHSVKEIITRVGKEKLMQWLMMIIYSRSSKNVNAAKSHYSILIQNRIDTMLGILAKLKVHENRKLQEQTRLVAMLSLLENVFEVDLETTLKAFYLEYAVEEALLNRSGIIGNLLSIALAIEEGNYATMQELLGQLELKVEDIEDILNKSLDASKQ
jgi:EAL and modified HD-GYP domain-containing signal transduction protein